MLKRIFILPFLVILSTYSYAKLKEKRSYKSFIYEIMLKIKQTKKAFLTVEGARQAQSNIQVETYGPHTTLNHQFKCGIKRETITGATTYIINEQKDEVQDVVLYIHGGAWFKDPLDAHFQFVDQLANELNAIVIMPIYPKVPHANYQDTFNMLEVIYNRIQNKYQNGVRITLIGDSAGGQIALSFAQLMKLQGINQPDNLVLISPVLDASLSNPDIFKYKNKDPMLGVHGLKYFIKQWASELPIEDWRISPINGNLTGLGNITLIVGTKELLYPDVRRLSTLLNQYKVPHEFIIGYNLFHIYPVFDIPERRQVITKLRCILKQ